MSSTLGRSSPFEDHSVVLAGSSVTILPEREWSSVVERVIANPDGDTASGAILHINPTGVAAVAEGAGTIALLPGQSIRLYNTNAITAIGTGPITVLERRQAE